MTAPAVAGTDDQIAEGEKIYFEGSNPTPACQICHGKDAMGLIGPPIVGKTADLIFLQMEINPSMQGLIVLSDSEVEAVGAYLQSLGPPVAPPPQGQ